MKYCTLGADLCLHTGWISCAGTGGTLQCEWLTFRLKGWTHSLVCSGFYKLPCMLCACEKSTAQSCFDQMSNRSQIASLIRRRDVMTFNWTFPWRRPAGSERWPWLMASFHPVQILQNMLYTAVTFPQIFTRMLLESSQSFQMCKWSNNAFIGPLTSLLKQLYTLDSFRATIT